MQNIIDKSLDDLQSKFSEQGLPAFRAKQVYSWLHRKLTALGVRNYVVCPTRLDERHQGVANDRTDALELATRLDRYVAGNDRALAVVRVPTEAEEQKRAHTYPVPSTLTSK